MKSNSEIIKWLYLNSPHTLNDSVNWRKDFIEFLESGSDYSAVSAEEDECICSDSSGKDRVVCGYHMNEAASQEEMKKTMPTPRFIPFRPCPHGRAPTEDADGCYSCPHCLGINNRSY